MKIHPSPYDEYVDPPAIVALLDSIAFFWFVVLVTVILFSWIAWKLWELHSVPKKISKELGWRQARLVFWLTMLGLIWKPLWVIAVILVVLDWDALADWIRALQSPKQPSGTVDSEVSPATGIATQKENALASAEKESPV